MGNGALRAHVRPHSGLLRRLGVQPGAGPVNITKLLDDVVAVDALAGVLTRGIEAVTTSDGRLDTKDLAAFVLRQIRENQR